MVVCCIQHTMLTGGLKCWLPVRGAELLWAPGRQGTQMKAPSSAVVHHGSSNEAQLGCNLLPLMSVKLKTAFEHITLNPPDFQQGSQWLMDAVAWSLTAPSCPPGFPGRSCCSCLQWQDWCFSCLRAAKQTRERGINSLLEGFWVCHQH